MLTKSNIYTENWISFILFQRFFSCVLIFSYIISVYLVIVDTTLYFTINVFWFQFRKVCLIYFCLLCSLQFSIGSLQIISIDKPVDNFNMHIMRSLLKFKFRKSKFVSKHLSFLKASHVILTRPFDKKEKNTVTGFFGFTIDIYY